MKLSQRHDRLGRAWQLEALAMSPQQHTVRQNVLDQHPTWNLLPAPLRVIIDVQNALRFSWGINMDIHDQFGQLPTEGNRQAAQPRSLLR